MTLPTSQVSLTSTPTQSSSPHTPLLTDEELDALIAAFNRRDSTPVNWHPWHIGLPLLTLLMVGLGWWW